MRKLILTIALINCSISLASSLFDNELRCCLTISDRKNTFVINLTTPGLTKAELRITVPTGVTAGYLPQQNQFTKPMPSLIYASFTDGYTRFEHHHQQGRNKGFVIKKLIPGDYKLDVFGVRDGSYALSINLSGRSLSVSNIYSGKGYINIKKGDVHSYQFPGSFDDPFDGSIRMSSPTRFKMKRIK